MIKKIVILLLLSGLGLTAQGPAFDKGQEVTPPKKEVYQVGNVPYKAMALVLEKTMPLATVQQGPLPPGIFVYFNTPPKNGQIEQTIVNLIANAKTEILFNQYAVTSQNIADALVKARHKNITVVGILEEKPNISKYNAPGYFIQNDVPVFYDNSPGVDNNKYCVIDRSIVITGSYDWTKSSNERNAENAIIINEPTVAQAYYNQFIFHLNNTVIPQQLRDKLKKRL